MCNLYSITTNQAAIIELFRVINRYVGNLPPMPGVFPDYPAPVIRLSWLTAAELWQQCRRLVRAFLQKDAYQPSGNGTSGQRVPLSLAATVCSLSVSGSAF